MSTELIRKCDVCGTVIPEDSATSVSLLITLDCGSAYKQHGHYADETVDFCCDRCYSGFIANSLLPIVDKIKTEVENAEAELARAITCNTQTYNQSTAKCVGA